MLGGRSAHRIRAKGVRWKVTGLRERGGSLLCSGCQGWPLGVSQLRRRSLYHIKGASKEPLQQHFGPAWKNRACFDWSATFYCHHSADQQLAPASAILPLWLFERRSRNICAHTCAQTHAGMQMCTYKHAHGHTHAHVHLCVCTTPLPSTHTHTHTHTYTDRHENPRAY